MPPAAVSAVGGYANLEEAPEISRFFRAGAVIAATLATRHSSPSLAEVDGDAQAHHADRDLYGHTQIGRRGRAGRTRCLYKLRVSGAMGGTPIQNRIIHALRFESFIVVSNVDGF